MRRGRREPRAPELDLRYEKLRTRKPEAERKLLASLAEIGQQVPVVVVRGEAPEQFVLIDGYKRVRALRRLGQDLVAGTCWDLREAEALVLDRLMRTGEGATALEQGWLLHELTVRFELALEDLGRRFARSASWVSRRRREQPASLRRARVPRLPRLRGVGRGLHAAAVSRVCVRASRPLLVQAPGLLSELWGAADGGARGLSRRRGAAAGAGAPVDSPPFVKW